MSVRLAKVEDINQIIELGKKLITRSSIKASVFDAQAKQVIRRAINDANMNVWVADHQGAIVGFLLVVKEQHWFSRDKCAADLCFIVDDKHGNYAASMIRRYVKWAKSDARVTDICLGITSGMDKDGRTGRMYQNLGFTPTGGNFTYQGV